MTAGLQRFIVAFKCLAGQLVIHVQAIFESCPYHGFSQYRRTIGTSIIFCPMKLRLNFSGGLNPFIENDGI